MVVPKKKSKLYRFGTECIETHGFGDPLFLRNLKLLPAPPRNRTSGGWDKKPKRRVSLQLDWQGSGHVRVRVPPLKQHCNIYPDKNVRIQLPSGAISCRQVPSGAKPIQFWVGNGMNKIIASASFSMSSLTKLQMSWAIEGSLWRTARGKTERFPQFPAAKLVTVDCKHHELGCCRAPSSGGEQLESCSVTGNAIAIGGLHFALHSRHNFGILVDVSDSILKRSIQSWPKQ